VDLFLSGFQSATSFADSLRFSESDQQRQRSPSPLDSIFGIFGCRPMTIALIFGNAADESTGRESARFRARSGTPGSGKSLEPMNARIKLFELNIALGTSRMLGARAPGRITRANISQCFIALDVIVRHRATNARETRNPRGIGNRYFTGIRGGRSESRACPRRVDVGRARFDGRLS